MPTSQPSPSHSRRSRCSGSCRRRRPSRAPTPPRVLRASARSPSSSPSGCPRAAREGGSGRAPSRSGSRSASRGSRARSPGRSRRSKQGDLLRLTGGLARSGSSADRRAGEPDGATGLQPGVRRPAVQAHARRLHPAPRGQARLRRRVDHDVHHRCALLSTRTARSSPRRSAFLNENRDDVAFVTIDLGANDVLSGGGSRPSWPTCRRSSGRSKPRPAPDVPIVGMNYYDPLLAAVWFSTGSQAAVQAARGAVGGAQRVVLGSIYAPFGIPVADVSDRVLDSPTRRSWAARR